MQSDRHVQLNRKLILDTLIVKFDQKIHWDLSQSIVNLKKLSNVFGIMHCEVNHQFIGIKGGIKFKTDHKIFGLIRAIFAQLLLKY